MDQKHFDDDVDNCFLLTNEEILAGNLILNSEDAEYHQKYLISLKAQFDEISIKRKNSYQQTKEKTELIRREYKNIIQFQ